MELKTECATKLESMKAEEMRLIYKGKILKDEQTLDSYKITDGMTVHLVKGKSAGAKPADTTTTEASSSSELGAGAGAGPTRRVGPADRSDAGAGRARGDRRSSGAQQPICARRQPSSDRSHLTSVAPNAQSNSFIARITKTGTSPSNTGTSAPRWSRLR